MTNTAVFRLGCCLGVVALMGSSCPVRPCACLAPPGSARIHTLVQQAGAPLAGAEVRVSSAPACTDTTYHWTAPGDYQDIIRTDSGGWVRAIYQFPSVDSTCVWATAYRTIGSTLDSAASSRRRIHPASPTPNDTVMLSVSFAN